MKAVDPAKAPALPPCPARVRLHCSSSRPAGPSAAGTAASPPQPDCLPLHLGQISGAQSVCGKPPPAPARHVAAPLDDQIDRLRRERLFLHRLPTVDRPEDRPLRDVGPLLSPVAFPREMPKGFDIVVSKELREPVAPVHRQNGRERVEPQRATSRRVKMKGRGVSFRLTPRLRPPPRDRCGRDRDLDRAGHGCDV